MKIDVVDINNKKSGTIELNNAFWTRASTRHIK